MQMVQGVLVQQMRFVEQEDGVLPVGAQLLDVGGDGMEQRARGGSGGLYLLHISQAASEI